MPLRRRRSRRSATRAYRIPLHWQMSFLCLLFCLGCAFFHEVLGRLLLAVLLAFHSLAHVIYSGVVVEGLVITRNSDYSRCQYLDRRGYMAEVCALTHRVGLRFRAFMPGRLLDSNLAIGALRTRRRSTSAADVRWRTDRILPCVHHGLGCPRHWFHPAEERSD